MIKKLDETVLEVMLGAGTDDEVIDLVLAALVGEAAVDAVLAGEPGVSRPDPSAERVSPRGAFLTRLVVRRFRGVGRETTLNIPAGPGLTVIAGRNGSGKSSLSEALEWPDATLSADCSRRNGRRDSSPRPARLCSSRAQSTCPGGSRSPRPGLAGPPYRSRRPPITCARSTVR